jgi:hypothetical protein
MEREVEESADVESWEKGVLDRGGRTWVKGQ